MAFTRDDLSAYEKGTQATVADDKNPFDGATPSPAAASAESEATSADATPPSGDDTADSVQPVAGDGTSDETSESSTETPAAPSDETETKEEASDDAPAPKKGSAAERLQEVLALRKTDKDTIEALKEFGSLRDTQVKEMLAEIQRLRGPGTPSSPAAPKQPVKSEAVGPMPKLSDEDVSFDTDKYESKMEKWIDAKAAAAAAKVTEENKGKSAQQQLEADVNAKLTKFAADHADFNEVVGKNEVLSANQLSTRASIAVAKSEFTADMLYHFGKNPAYAVKVAKMDEAQQLVEIGKLEARFETVRDTAPNVKEKTPAPPAKGGNEKSITNAPPPPKPVKGAGRPDRRDITDPNMSMDEFVKRHREEKSSARDENKKLRSGRR